MAATIRRRIISYSCGSLRVLCRFIESGPKTHLSSDVPPDSTEYRIPLLHEDEVKLYHATVADQWRLGYRRNARHLPLLAHKHGVKPEINVQPIKYINHDDHDENKLDKIQKFSEFGHYYPKHESTGITTRKVSTINRLQPIWRRNHALGNQDKLSGSGYSHVVEIGKSFGPPRKVLEDGTLSSEYDTRFNSKLLQCDYRSKVFSKGGTTGFRVTIAVGNGNGLLGIGMTYHPIISEAMKEAKHYAYQQLVPFPMFEDGSIPYAVRGRYHRTELHAIPSPHKMDNKAQRTIKILLDLAGYKHVGVKMFGRSTPESICKAFMVTFQQFETHQQQSDRLGRFVVRFDPNTYFKPEVLAAPSDTSNPVPYSAEIEPRSILP